LELARKEFASTHRPRIVVRFIQGPLRDPKDNEFISVTIANVGGSPATVDAIGGDLARRNRKGEWALTGPYAERLPRTKAQRGAGQVNYTGGHSLAGQALPS
jgi:hypothetical protein